MGVVVFSKVQGLVKSESPRTRRLCMVLQKIFRKRSTHLFCKYQPYSTTICLNNKIMIRIQVQLLSSLSHLLILKKKKNLQRLLISLIFSTLHFSFIAVMYQLFPKNSTLHVYSNIHIYWFCNFCTPSTFIPTSTVIREMRVAKKTQNRRKMWTSQSSCLRNKRF